jgi:hypothetical protein
MYSNIFREGEAVEAVASCRDDAWMTNAAGMYLEQKTIELRALPIISQVLESRSKLDLLVINAAIVLFANNIRLWESLSYSAHNGSITKRFARMKLRCLKKCCI